MILFRRKKKEKEKTEKKVALEKQEKPFESETRVLTAEGWKRKILDKRKKS